MKRHVAACILFFVFLLFPFISFAKIFPTRIEFFRTERKFSSSIKVTNDGNENVSFKLEIVPLTKDEEGNFVPSDAEKKFCQAITYTPRVVMSLPPRQEQKIIFQIDPNKVMGEHYARLHLILTSAKKKTEINQNGIHAEVETVIGSGIPIFLFNDTAKMKAKIAGIIGDGKEKRILIEANGLSKMLYGNMEIYGIDDAGDQKLLQKIPNFLVINKRWFFLPSGEFRKVRIKYISMYDDSRVIVDEIVPLNHEKGAITLRANSKKLCENFPVLISDDGLIFIDVREFIKAMGFYSNKTDGIITGTTFGKAKWYKFNINERTAETFTAASFHLNSYLDYWLAPQDISKLFGIKAKFNLRELVLNVNSEQKFAFEIKGEIEGEKESEKKYESALNNYLKNTANTEKGKLTNIPAIAAEYSLSNFSQSDRNFTSLNSKFGANFSDFIFTTNYQFNTDKGGIFENEKLNYFSKKYKTGISLGELDVFSQNPLTNISLSGKGVEFFSLQQDEAFPFPTNKLLNGKNKEIQDEAYFYEGKYLNKDDLIYLKRGANQISHHSLSIYGDEVNEFQTHIIPSSYSGQGKISFHGSILQEAGTKKFLHNIHFNYGMRYG